MKQGVVVKIDNSTTPFEIHVVYPDSSVVYVYQLDDEDIEPLFDIRKRDDNGNVIHKPNM